MPEKRNLDPEGRDRAEPMSRDKLTQVKQGLAESARFLYNIDPHNLWGNSYQGELERLNQDTSNTPQHAMPDINLPNETRAKRRKPGK